jgi:uncharacterized protein (DUF2235 family)
VAAFGENSKTLTGRELLAEELSVNALMSPVADRKRLVLCFDGTWNNLKSHTNVSKLYSEIADETTGPSCQRKFYDEGVGTGTYDKIRGGVFGYGLDKNIRTGYAWLASLYEQGNAPLSPPRSAADPLPTGDGCPKDPAPLDAPRRSNGERYETPKHSSDEEFVDGSEIFLFGFSRGAFTARSMCGLINYLGIPLLERGTTSAAVSLSDLPQITQAWELYAARPTAKYRAEATGSEAQKITEHDEAVLNFRQKGLYPIRLHFVGVWDTVGALGIPKVFDYDWIPRFSSQYEFHDATLGESIRNAFHAVAIDEHRLPYAPTLWKSAQPTTEAVEQRWFPGAHADVGGGYEDDLLPAPPLEWLAGRAAACGLEFINDRHLATAHGKTFPAINQPPAAFDLDGKEYLSPVHDSYAEFLGGIYRVMRSLPFMGGPVYRRMLVAVDGLNQTIDETSFAKWRADAGYRPPNLGQAGRIDVSFNKAIEDGVIVTGRPAANAGAL